MQFAAIKYETCQKTNNTRSPFSVWCRLLLHFEQIYPFIFARPSLFTLSHTHTRTYWLYMRRYIAFIICHWFSYSDTFICTGFPANDATPSFIPQHPSTIFLAVGQTKKALRLFPQSIPLSAIVYLSVHLSIFAHFLRVSVYIRPPLCLCFKICLLKSPPHVYFDVIYYSVRSAFYVFLHFAAPCRHLAASSTNFLARHTFLSIFKTSTAIYWAS